MQANAIPALLAAVAGTALAPLAIYLPLVIAIAAVLAAILPIPAADSRWMPARKLLDLLAMNVGSAQNAAKAPSV